MKVKELIKALKAYDKNLDVEVVNAGYKEGRDGLPSLVSNGTRSVSVVLQQKSQYSDKQIVVLS